MDTNSKVILKIKHLSDTVYDIEIDPSSTALDLKKLLQQKTNIPTNEQKLIFKGIYFYFPLNLLSSLGKMLKDADVLSTYKVETGSAMHLVILYLSILSDCKGSNKNKRKRPTYYRH